jgi:hypothetical protein
MPVIRVHDFRPPLRAGRPERDRRCSMTKGGVAQMVVRPVAAMLILVESAVAPVKIGRVIEVDG